MKNIYSFTGSDCSKPTRFAMDTTKPGGPEFLNDDGSIAEISVRHDLMAKVKRYNEQSPWVDARDEGAE